MKRHLIRQIFNNLFLMKTFFVFHAQVLCMAFLSGLCAAQNVPAQKGKDELLANFKSSGDVQILTKLWRATHGLEPGYDFNAEKNVASKSELIEKDAEFYLQTLSAIGKRQRLLAAEREPVAKTLTEFGNEMRLRKDQPFITPGKTKPEAIPDLQYRQRYVEYLSAREVDLKHAEIAGTLASLDTSFRADTILSLERLSDADKLQLLDRVAPETISPETVKLLSERFKIPFLYKEKKPVLLER